MSTVKSLYGYVRTILCTERLRASRKSLCTGVHKGVLRYTSTALLQQTSRRSLTCHNIIHHNNIMHQRKPRSCLAHTIYFRTTEPTSPRSVNCTYIIYQRTFNIRRLDNQRVHYRSGTGYGYGYGNLRSGEKKTASTVQYVVLSMSPLTLNCLLKRHTYLFSAPSIAVPWRLSCLPTIMQQQMKVPMN